MGSMEQLGVAQPSLPPPNTQQAFENAINMPNAKLNAAAPWQANAGPSPPPASFTPLPNFKAAFNPFGSALPNVPNQSKAREGRAPELWIGSLPAVKPHRKPEVLTKQQNQRLRKQRRLREIAARDAPEHQPPAGHFVDPIGAVRQEDGTLQKRERWRPTQHGLGAGSSRAVYRQPECRPRREDTSWRVFGNCASSTAPELTPVERVRALREAAAVARHNEAALKFAQQGASAAMFRPEQDPNGLGNQRAMGGNFENTAEGVYLPAKETARLPAMSAMPQPGVTWGARAESQQHVTTQGKGVPHSQLTGTQKARAFGATKLVTDKGSRQPHTEQYRADSMRTLVSPTFDDPAFGATAQSYHHTVDQSLAKHNVPQKQQPFPMGNQGNRRKLATMDPLVSQFAQWDDPVVG